MAKNSNIINLVVVLGFFNLIGLLIVIILPEWRISSTVASDPSFRGIRYKEGLWTRCTAHVDQYYQCDMYETDGVIGIDGKNQFLFRKKIVRVKNHKISNYEVKDLRPINNKFSIFDISLKLKKLIFI